MKFTDAVSKKNKRILQRASAIAETSTLNYKHGAIIMKGGNVISVGVNRNKTDPRLLAEDSFRQSSVHAEVAAIKGSHGANLNGAVIYVARVNNFGKQMMSKPCEECQKTLKEVGIKKVYYTIDSSLTIE